MSRSKQNRRQIIARLTLALFALGGLLAASQWQTPIAKSSDFIDPSIQHRFDQTMERWN